MPSQLPKETHFLSISEIAEITGLHPVSVRRMIADGRIPSAKLGGRRLISRDWLNNLETLAGKNIATAVVGGSL